MSRPVIAANRSGRSESQEMVTLCSPACSSGNARRSSVAPLVVIDSSTGRPGQAADQFGQMSPHRRLAASDADRANAEALDEDRCYALDLFEGEDLGAGQPAHVLLRHAIGAAEIATVRDGDPQVVDLAAEAVQQRVNHSGYNARSLL